MTPADFIAQYLPLAQSVAAQTGLDPSVVLAQAGLETGWGTSSAALTGNNFFGISPGGTLATYASPQAGWSAYASLINSRYSQAASMFPGNAAGQAQEIGSLGYATAPGYGTTLAGLAGQVSTMLAGATGSSQLPAAGGSTVSPTAAASIPTTTVTAPATNATGLTFYIVAILVILALVGAGIFGLIRSPG